MWYSVIGYIVTLTLSLLAAPLVVEAQPSAPVPRIGLLSILSPAVGQAKAESFRQGLREAGYMEGKNILIESRWADGHRERFAELAADLVRMQVAVIGADSTPAALAAKQATLTGIELMHMIKKKTDGHRGQGRGFHCGCTVLLAGCLIFAQTGPTVSLHLPKRSLRDNRTRR
jgi:hypothetical protein